MPISSANLVNFQEVVTHVINDWNAVKPTVSSWFSVNSSALSEAFKVLFNGVDQLVQQASKLNADGVDKKAAVLFYAGSLFDNIVVPFLPTWLPTVVVRTIFMSVLSAMIEFAVTKMKEKLNG